MENLSANQRWKRSGTTLPFKEWINRENEKAKANADVESSFIPYNENENNTTQFSAFDSNDDTNQLINDTIKSTFNTPSVATQENTNQVLGLDKKIFIFSSLLVLGSLSFYFYKKLKAKK